MSALASPSSTPAATISINHFFEQHCHVRESVAGAVSACLSSLLYTSIYLPGSALPIPSHPPPTMCAAGTGRILSVGPLVPARPSFTSSSRARRVDPLLDFLLRHVELRGMSVSRWSNDCTSQGCRHIGVQADKHCVPPFTRRIRIHRHRHIQSSRPGTARLDRSHHTMLAPVLSSLPPLTLYCVWSRQSRPTTSSRATINGSCR